MNGSLCFFLSVSRTFPHAYTYTHRNMWAICAFFNPVLTVLSVVILRIPDLGPDQLNDILSRLGLVAGGEWLQKLVAADACLVLAGSPL